MRGDFLGDARGRVPVSTHITIRQAMALFALAERDHDGSVAAAMREALLAHLERNGIDVTKIEYRDFYCFKGAKDERPENHYNPQQNAAIILCEMHKRPVHYAEMMSLTGLSKRAIYNLIDNISEVVPMKSTYKGVWRLADGEESEDQDAEVGE